MATRGSQGRLRPWFVRKVVPVGAALLALSVLGACGGSSTEPGSPGSSGGSASATPKSGGSLTVLMGPGLSEFMQSLDPLGTHTHVQYGITAALYGQLFWLSEDGSAVPGLATSYKFVNNKTVVIHLRKGVKFSDGTPFNADAVKFTLDRARPSNSSIPIASVKVTDPYTVQVNLKTPDVSFIDELFDTTLNYVISPTAFRKEGKTKFSTHPVGAGPFVVDSFTPNDTVALKRNPTYWQKGRPYLDHLTFKAVGSDEAAYQAMLAGQGDAYQDLENLQLVDKFKSHFVVTEQPSFQNRFIDLDTSTAPFNNIKARQAIYYAMDREQLNKSLFGGKLTVSDSFQNSASKFPMVKVPGYPEHDLAKAKALVKSLGGVKFTLWYAQGSSFATKLAEGLQKQFEAAGMKVSLDDPGANVIVSNLPKHKWQAWIFRSGAYDPGAWPVSLIYDTNSIFAGVHDKTVNRLMNEGKSTLDKTKRAAIYKKLVQRITDNAYGPYLFQWARYSVATKETHGPGLTTGILSGTPAVMWADVWTSK